MKNIFIVVCISFLSNFIHSQISKGDYLFGGSVYLGYYNNDSFNGTNKDNRQFGLSINPSVGYFVKDKFAIGTSLSYNFNYVLRDDNSYHSFGIGPYLRYYFLEKEKSINIFTHFAYNISTNHDFDEAYHSFTLGTGPVFFINKSIAIETGLYYNYQKFYDINVHNIYMGAGFNLHLDRSSKK